MPKNDTFKISNPATKKLQEQFKICYLQLLQPHQLLNSKGSD
jgi:hypothetical protein